MTMTVLGTLKTLLSPLGGGKEAATPAGGDGAMDFATLLDGAGDAPLPQGLGLAIAAAPGAALGMSAQLGAATQADLPSANLAAALGLAVATADRAAPDAPPAADAAEPAVELPIAVANMMPAAKGRKHETIDHTETEQFSREISKKVRLFESSEPNGNAEASELEKASTEAAPLPLPIPDGAMLSPAMAPIVAPAQVTPTGSPLGTAANEPNISAPSVDRTHPLVASSGSPAPRGFRLAPPSGVAPADEAPLTAAPITAPIHSAGQPEIIASARQASPTPVEAPSLALAAGEVAVPEASGRTIRQLRDSAQTQPGEATALLRMLSDALGGKSNTTPTSRATPKDASAAVSGAQAAAVPVSAMIPRDSSASVSTRSERTGDGEATAVDALSPTAERGHPAIDPSIAAPRAPLSTQPAQTQPVDLSASLGQQVIDMSSGSQWIDGLAREIAALSKGEGAGSFRLSPEHLGPMRVDIRNGDQGAQVTLTVETETAQNMLQQDSGRLKADAQLSSIRIADVVVERVHHVAEPARSDGGMNQGNNGQQPQHQASAQAGFAQGQGQSQPNAQSNSKASGGQAVLNHAEPQDQAVEDDGHGGSRHARYA